MTDITVKLDPESGAATIELRGPTVAEPRFRLRDIATEKFLTRRGWSKTASYLPGEAVTAADFTVLVLDAELARRVTAGMNLSFEQPASNIFASVRWPQPVGAVAEDAGSAQADPDKTDPQPETDADAADDMTAAADADAAKLKDDFRPDEAVKDDDEPRSLEPSIRDEAITPYRADVPPVAVKPAVQSKPVDDDEDDEDERGTSWSKLAAAALFFMVLGSVLTYFWQSSAYDSELRTAMRAVEAQSDKDKTDLEKRLADAQSNPGATTGETVTATDAKVASLTSQAADLAKDRDAALVEVSEQQAKVKALEERLSTAQGEIESLKAAAEAGATEQTAIFNARIDTLGKELDTARIELEKSRAELAGRDQALARAGEDLGKANSQIATLRKAADEKQTVQSDEVETRIGSLSAELDKAAQDLATRDASLRDAQSKLSVANVQIEALKQVAGKATEADLERSALADRITDLTSQIDKADKDVAARDAELRKARTSLDTANALLASNAEEIGRLKSTTAATATSDVNPQSDPDTARLKEERDLFSRELAAMTESFNALKAERDRLAAAPGNAEEQSASLDTNAAVSESRAVWGATAIDQAGAIYSLQNQIAEKSATDNVVALCRGKSNGRCEPLRAYSNSCFSLARIDGEGPRNDNFGFSVDKDWQSAESGAVRQCQELGGNCTVRFTACSPDALSKPSVNQ